MPEPVAPTPRARRWERLVGPIAIGLPLLVVTLHEFWTMRVGSVTQGDGAASEIAARSALHLHRLLGPYSRFRWDHPGPAFFYWMAPFFSWSGQRYGGMTVAAALLNLIVVGMLIAVAWRAGGWRAAVATSLATLLLFGVTNVDRWRSPWNPDVVILPMAAFIVMTAAVVGRRRWVLPLQIGAGSFLIQTHVGTAPIVMALLAVGVVAVLYVDRHELADWLWPALAAVAMGLLAWSLPIYQQLTHQPGNLGVLVNYFRHSHPTNHPWHEVAHLVVVQAGLTGSASRAVAGPEGPLAPLTWWRWGVFIGLLAIVAYGLVAAIRRGDRFAAGLRGAVLGAVAVGTLAVIRVDGILFPYLVTFLLAVGLCLWAAALSTVIDVVSPLLAHRSPVRVLRAGAGAVSAVLLVFAVLLVARWRHLSPAGPKATNPVVTQLADAIRGRAPKSRPLMVVFWENDTWIVGVGVVDLLERDGYKVEVSQPWEFMVGQDHGPRNDHAQRFVINLPDGTPPTGSVPIPLTLPSWSLQFKLGELPAGLHIDGTGQ